MIIVFSCDVIGVIIKLCKAANRQTIEIVEIDNFNVKIR